MHILGSSGSPSLNLSSEASILLRFREVDVLENSLGRSLGKISSEVLDHTQVINTTLTWSMAGRHLSNPGSSNLGSDHFVSKLRT